MSLWLFNHTAHSNCCFIQTKLLTSPFKKKLKEKIVASLLQFKKLFVRINNMLDELEDLALVSNLTLLLVTIRPCLLPYQ